MRTVAYVLGTFPTLTETFILGEILELRRRGIPLVVFALRRSRDPVQQPESRAFETEVGYACALSSPRLLAANAARAARHPLRYLRALALLIRGTLRNPVHLTKTLYLFPKAVELADRMERLGVGHVHAHWATYPATVALAISELTEVPFSFTGHAGDVSLIRTLLAEKVRRAAFVLTCTAANQRMLRALLPDSEQAKVILNYHGIPVDRFSTTPARGGEATPVIVGCGSLFERKGFADLVRACGVLKRQGRRFRCVIIGEGPQHHELEALIAAEGLGEGVALAGPLPQDSVIRHYAAGDLFVLPCVTRPLRLRDPEGGFLKGLEAWFEGPGRLVTDGIPNVLAEAMAAGLPVVSTRVGGIPELVADGRNGLLVPPGDPAALAAAIDRLLADPELRRRLGAAGARDVRARFDRTRNAQDLADVFLREPAVARVSAPAARVRLRQPT